MKRFCDILRFIFHQALVRTAIRCCGHPVGSFPPQGMLSSHWLALRRMNRQHTQLIQIENTERESI
jgi:hypothetical protein